MLINAEVRNYKFMVPDFKRYAVTCGLIADFAGIIAAILLAYLFFY